MGRRCPNRRCRFGCLLGFRGEKRLAPPGKRATQAERVSPGSPLGGGGKSSNKARVPQVGESSRCVRLALGRPDSGVVDEDGRGEVELGGFLPRRRQVELHLRCLGKVHTLS